ncbi:hypothetical protein CVT26_012438 [Gymnopilus dilepis]|uniref:Protein kinase domain-containing protein n=1 Tax=Gymnopilus dilepis TaxID=231916 RepID=A0A409YWC9_9AGAR|nr:hypothetical protein CVT26_012438 [Gymnopilus dilepis]
MDALQRIFAFDKKEEPDMREVKERRKFWDSPQTFQWFKDRGYTLYSRTLDDEGNPLCLTVPRLPSEIFQEAQYPFAYHDGSVSTMSGTPLGVEEFAGTVAFAQDTLNRHVAIKIVPDGTDEYRVLRFLTQQKFEDIQKHCLIPVLELLPVESFWFAIMPRWGTGILAPTLDKAYEVLDIMHSMLKALTYLHEHNISHGVSTFPFFFVYILRDIKFGNVLVNQFAEETIFDENSSRRELRRKGLLSYALFDFDLSIMLPPGSDRTTYRLPYQRSWGTFNWTMDTAQGEFDFNPFVLDVGTMGVVFCTKFQIPFLAPLLDKMTTRFLEKRFTASEALRFFEKMRSQLTKAELDQEVISRFPGNTVPYYEYDRWKSIPHDVAKQWSSYKEPPIPWSIRILRTLCQRIWILHAVAHVRWLSFRANSFVQGVFLRLRLR